MINQQLQHELQCRHVIHKGHVESREFTRSPHDPPPPMSSLSSTIAAQQQGQSERHWPQEGQSRLPSRATIFFIFFEISWFSFLDLGLFFDLGGSVQLSPALVQLWSSSPAAPCSPSVGVPLHRSATGARSQRCS